MPVKNMSTTTAMAAAAALAALLAAGSAIDMNELGMSWADSFSVGGRCYCDTNYDHDIGKAKPGAGGTGRASAPELALTSSASGILQAPTLWLALKDAQYQSSRRAG
jgi:hypothetical protein